MTSVLSNVFAGFVDCLLRGVGQVMLQNNAITGLLFLVGVFISDWISGLYALTGTVVATGTAMLFGAREDDIRRGLFGFNGTLTGVSLAFYLRHNAALPMYAILACMLVTVVMAAIQDIFGDRFYALTGPFVVTTWIFIGAARSFADLGGSPALGAPHLPTDVIPAVAVLSPGDVVTGLLNGLAQVMFQKGVWTGVFFLVAIAVNSRAACLAAALGSATAIGFAWLLGAAPGSIRAGLYSFNAVLTAIAVGTVFFRLQRTSMLLATLAVGISAILYGSLVRVLSPLGLPPLTAPFVTITWLCLLAKGRLVRLQALAQ